MQALGGGKPAARAAGCASIGARASGGSCNDNGTKGGSLPLIPDATAGTCWDTKKWLDVHVLSFIKRVFQIRESNV